VVFEQGCAYVVKSVTPARMQENFDAQGFRIEQEDLERINAMPFEGEYNDAFQLFGIHIFK
jgi:diketogulonate reductase-like aldo/keto reductase